MPAIANVIYVFLLSSLKYYEYRTVLVSDRRSLFLILTLTLSLSLSVTLSYGVYDMAALMASRPQDVLTIPFVRSFPGTVYE